MIQEQCPKQCTTECTATSGSHAHCVRCPVHAAHYPAHATCCAAAQHPCRGRARWRFHHTMLSALGAHTFLAGRDTKGHVATPVPLPCPGRVATPNSGRDPKQARPCRDTNFRSPCSLRVATPRAMSRHPNGCPRNDMKIMSRPRTNLVPVSTTSRHKIDVATWGQDPCRACTKTRLRSLLRCHAHPAQLCTWPAFVRAM